MPRAETVRVALFVASVASVYAAALPLGVSEMRRRLAGRAAPDRTRFARAARRVVFSLAGLGLLCMLWGFLVEPRWLEVTRPRLVSAKLDAPLRIALVSDFHCDATPGLEERLPGLIALEKPDAIVFAGDAVNSKEGVPVFNACLARLAALAPLFAVRGNWDLASGMAWNDGPADDAARASIFAGTGARVLDGEAACLRSGVWIAGIAAHTHDDQVARALAPVPPGALRIFVAHYPDEIESAAARGADLYLAGHTHGGQVALPFYGALTTASRYDKTYESGLYRVGETWLYVNRGIGTDGAGAPRCRFCARPELTILEISPATR
jgi:predicted MPP superfamily phosphohydrolase